MSLNRSEQRIFDYVQKHREEGQYWQDKVRATSRAEVSDQAAVARLEPELWRYYLERSSVVPALMEAARVEGKQRTSMKNLAELLLRLWTEPRPKKKTGENPSAGGQEIP
ncbi:MAG: hypothetical protein HZA93_09235 [Verrucomicrobia bacterium]|nr:hypothetical protein [Verrucomicrobiota bacterium]